MRTYTDIHLQLGFDLLTPEISTKRFPKPSSFMFFTLPKPPCSSLACFSFHFSFQLLHRMSGHVPRAFLRRTSFTGALAMTHLCLSIVFHFCHSCQLAWLQSVGENTNTTACSGQSVRAAIPDLV